MEIVGAVVGRAYITHNTTGLVLTSFFSSCWVHVRPMGMRKLYPLVLISMFYTPTKKRVSQDD